MPNPPRLSPSEERDTPMPFCREQSIKASCHFGEIAAPIKCRSWNCELCAPWRQRQLQARAIEGAPNRFITITCRVGEFGSKNDNARAIARAWRIIVQRWRRLNKWHKCEYLCVFEPHTSGWPHLHVLWSGHWIDFEWLSAQTNQLLNSPRVHVSRIKGKRSAAYYVAKYFTKAPTRFGTTKRYWTSKSWPKYSNTDAPRAFRADIPIIRVNEPIESLIATWRRSHKHVYELPPDLWGWGVLYNPATFVKDHKDRPIRSHDGQAWRKTPKGWKHA